MEATNSIEATNSKDELDEILDEISEACEAYLRPVFCPASSPCAEGLAMPHRIALAVKFDLAARKLRAYETSMHLPGQANTSRRPKEVRKAREVVGFAMAPSMEQGIKDHLPKPDHRTPFFLYPFGIPVLTDPRMEGCDDIHAFYDRKLWRERLKEQNEWDRIQRQR